MCVMPMVSATAESVSSGVCRSASPSKYTSPVSPDPASTPSVIVQSPPSTSGSRPSARIAATSAATPRATSATRSRSRRPSTGATARNGVTGRSPRSSTSSPAWRSPSSSPAARHAAGAFSWPGLCEPAVVGTPRMPILRSCTVIRLAFM